jgi:RNA polymerase II subunit A small phosphatase-like protein
MKKVTKVSSQGRPTTASKPAPATTESSAARSTAQQSEKDTPKQPESIITAGTAVETASSSGLRDESGVNSSAVPASQPSARAARDQPLPDLPRESEKAAADQSAQNPSSPALFVVAPTPNGKNETGQASPESDTSKSKDIAMVEVPPAPVDTKADSKNQVVPQTKSSDLPPPPPLPTPDSNLSSSSPAGTSIVGDVAEEKQQWLLPPIEPRFHGKKCLVLDLDETLVHSSFKV